VSDIAQFQIGDWREIRSFQIVYALRTNLDHVIPRFGALVIDQ